MGTPVRATPHRAPALVRASTGAASWRSSASFLGGVRRFLPSFGSSPSLARSGQGSIGCSIENACTFSRYHSVDGHWGATPSPNPSLQGRGFSRQAKPERTFSTRHYGLAYRGRISAALVANSPFSRRSFSLATQGIVGALRSIQSGIGVRRPFLSISANSTTISSRE